MIIRIHLWLGLTSGLIVLLLSVTGAIFEFAPEIQDWHYHDILYAREITGRPLPVSFLISKARKILGPDKKISWTTVFDDPAKNWAFYSYKMNPEGITYFSVVNHYDAVYLNPYSGKMAGIIDYKNDFFSLVKDLHWSLLLRTSVGQPIVGWATVIFVILLISGLFLWWPRSFRHAGNLFRLKWHRRTKFYRKLYDLHNVLGFYSMLIALIIALSGMVWSFQWFQRLVYVAASGTTSPPQAMVVHSVPTKSALFLNPIDLALHTARDKYADAAVFRIRQPTKDSLGTISIAVQELAGKYYRSNELLFDRYTGQLLDEKTQSDKNAGEKLIAAAYDIHVGAIAGLPGRIIAFLVCVICALLPVTGFLMWWKRTHSKKRKSLI